MNTMSRVEELVVDRGLTLFKLATLCDVPYSTLKNTKARGGQLAVDTIEQICHGLGITMAEFFAEGSCKHGT